MIRENHNAHLRQLQEEITKLKSTTGLKGDEEMMRSQSLEIKIMQYEQGLRAFSL